MNGVEYWQMYRFFIIIANMGNIQAIINWNKLEYKLNSLNIKVSKYGW